MDRWDKMKIIDKENYIFPNIIDYKKDYLKLETKLPEGVVLEKSPKVLMKLYLTI